MELWVLNHLTSLALKFEQVRKLVNKYLDISLLKSNTDSFFLFFFFFFFILLTEHTQVTPGLPMLQVNYYITYGQFQLCASSYISNKFS